MQSEACTPNEIVTTALANKELMRQVAESLEQERRGERPRPFRDILADLHEPREPRKPSE